MKYFSGDWNKDNKTMFAFLENMVVESGSDRNRMKYVNKKIGGSALYGHTWKSYLTPTKSRTPSKKYKGLCQTKTVDMYPEMDAVFAEFQQLYFPNFFYSQIQINKNFPTPKHKDSTNVGDSYICCFGEYTGGRTAVDFGGMGKSAVCYLNPREKPVCFNGSKFEHWTEDFEGKRYSLVYFQNIKDIEKKKL